MQRPESENATLPAVPHTEQAPAKEQASTSVSFQRLEVILERLEESARHSDDVVHFLRRRAEIEEVYAKSLRRLYEETAEAKVVSFRALRNKLTRGAAGGEAGSRLTESSSRAWNAVTAQTLQASQLHQAFAERLFKGPTASLAKATLDAHTRRKDVEKRAERLAKELREAQKRVVRAQEVAKEAETRTLAAGTGAAGLSGAAAGASLLGALFKKPPSAAVSAEAALAQQSEASRRCDAANESYNATLPACLTELEACESERLACLKHVLNDYIESSCECCKALVALYPAALQLVATIDPLLDLKNQFGDGVRDVW